MKIITEAGGIICPACPSFYSKPKTIEQLSSSVIDRVLDLAGLEHSTFRWEENPADSPPKKNRNTKKRSN